MGQKSASRSIVRALESFDVFRYAILAASYAAISMVVQLEGHGLEARFWTTSDLPTIPKSSIRAISLELKRIESNCLIGWRIGGKLSFLANLRRVGRKSCNGPNPAARWHFSWRCGSRCSKELQAEINLFHVVFWEHSAVLDQPSRVVRDT